MPTHPRQFLGTNPHLWLCSLLIATPAIPSNSLEPLPKEDYEKPPPRSLCGVSRAHPSRHAESTLKLLQKSFYCYLYACLLFLLLVGTLVRITACVRTGLARNRKCWPFLWHSLMELVWKTINLSEETQNLTVCCDSVTFPLLSQWNKT